MDLGLDGKIAVVTGASRGIGLAIVNGLTAHGVQVIAAARRATPELTRLAEAGQVQIVEVDLAQPGGPADLIAAAGQRIDLLVNNVGNAPARPGGFLSISDADWLATFALNVLAAVRTTREALPLMLAAGGGVIVNTSSVNASLPDPNVIDYGAAKAALACRQPSREPVGHRPVHPARRSSGGCPVPGQRAGREHHRRGRHHRRGADPDVVITDSRAASCARNVNCRLPCGHPGSIVGCMTCPDTDQFNVGIDSEVGQLREVIVHRPGRELDRLTPATAGELLFDDVLWSSRVRVEHDDFSRLLRSRGVAVRYFADLLAEAIATPGGRRFVTERTCTPERYGTGLAQALAAVFTEADPVTLADYLIAGLTKSELVKSHSLSGHSLTWQSLDDEDFVLAPLPNTMFQRDNASWIGQGLSINPMAKAARTRESISTRAVYRFHPQLRGVDYFRYLEEPGSSSGTLEGGDLAVLAPGVVLAGLGGRTNPVGVELLASRLFETSQAHSIIAVELPKADSDLHLDTVLTMVDIGTFVAYPSLDWQHLRCWQLTPAAGRPGDIEFTEQAGLWPALAVALGEDSVRILMAGEGSATAKREQWNRADSYLAIAPGLVIGYDRNDVTNAMLNRNGIEVIPLDGSELSRSAGGAHALSCPVRRDPVPAA
jgi:arginine deiminase